MQSLHHLLTYEVHDIDHMLRYPLSIYLSSTSIILRVTLALAAIAFCLVSSSIITQFLHQPPLAAGLLSRPSPTLEP